jgi:hypothetical protein
MAAKLGAKIQKLREQSTPVGVNAPAAKGSN